MVIAGAQVEGPVKDGGDGVRIERTRLPGVCQRPIPVVFEFVLQRYLTLRDGMVVERLDPLVRSCRNQ